MMVELEGGHEGALGRTERNVFVSYSPETLLHLALLCASGANVVVVDMADRVENDAEKITKFGNKIGAQTVKFEFVPIYNIHSLV